MLFPAHIQARFPVETIPLALSYGGTRKGALAKAFHFKGTVADFMRDAREIGDAISYTQRPRWAGCLQGETAQSMLGSAHCPTAFDAFEKEKADLVTKPTYGQPALSVVGSAFSLARVQVGHPVAAFRRPRNKLAPVALDFSLSVSAGVQASDITASVARILRAAATYHRAGGAVKLTMHYALAFHKNNPETNAQGLLISLDMPLHNPSLAAFGGSVQFFRLFAIPAAQALSGESGDSLQCWDYKKPGIVNLSGMATDADDALAALRIK